MLSDAGNALYTRPGIKAWDEWACPACNDTGAGTVIGAAVWTSPVGDRLVYVTSDRRLWAMLGPNNRIALSDATAATQLDGTSRPTFALTKSRIVIAGGGAPQKWEGAGLSARLGGSPPNLSHVVANATRLVGSNPTVGGFEYWSEPGETPGNETWIDSGEAEATPDPILATHENSNEVYAFGSATLQLFLPDPNEAYITGRASNFGLAAAYSVIRAGEAFLLLAQDEGGRLFAATSGRSLTPLSLPGMSKTIDRLATVSDCWGFRAQIDSWDLAVWVCPTEGRTFVFEAGNKQWSEWKSRSGAVDIPWIGTAHATWKARNLNLIGLPDGTMGILDADTFQDAGAALVGTVRTGFMDRGDANEKTCQRLALTMRRGGNGTANAPTVSVRWRDGLKAFCQPLTFSLGLNGETEAVVAKWTLGMYRTRQWQLEFSANARFVLASAEETYMETQA